MKKTAESKKRYPSIDALRALAAIGIIMMHMISKSNNQYDIGGVLAERIIPWFTQLVYLFMMISAFGMCCGYHERMLSGKIDLASFYKKRAARILPFFSFLVILDLITDFSFKRLLEGFANVTLMFGLLPEPSKLSFTLCSRCSAFSPGRERQHGRPWHALLSIISPAHITS